MNICIGNETYRDDYVQLFGVRNIVLEFVTSQPHPIFCFLSFLSTVPFD